MLNFDQISKIKLTLSGGGGGGGILRFSSITAKRQEIISDFNFTPLTVILRILSIAIVVRCCHRNLLFPVCHIIFWVEKQRILNYFQDNYLIKLKFGIGLFLGHEFKFIKNFKKCMISF